MIVALTAWRRPGYLRETLEALSGATFRFVADTLEPVFLVARCEPGNGDVIDILEGIKGRGAYVTVNPARLGLQANTRAVLDDAWALADRLGEDYVLGLPDDLVLAPDALQLAGWMRDRFRTDPLIGFTSLFSAESPCGPEHWHRVVTSDWFHCQGWGTWRDRWENLWRPRWGLDGRDDSWDSNVQQHVMPGLRQALPRLARCQHIGLMAGEHSTPELFERDLPKLFAGDVQLPPGEYWSDPC